MSVPILEVDDQAATIAFDIDVDEGEQFHFGELDVEGMEQAHREILISAWQRLRGRPYNPEEAKKFFNRYFRSPLRNIKSEDYTIRKIDVDSCESDQRSCLKAITNLVESDQAIGAQRRWRVDCGASDRNGQVRFLLDEAFRSEAKAWLSGDRGQGERGSRPFPLPPL